MPSVDLRKEIGRHRAARGMAEPGAGPAWTTAQEAVAGIVAWLGQEGRWPSPHDDPVPGAVEEDGDDPYGLGPLATLVRDRRVQDVLVVGADRVFAEVEGRLERQPVAFDDDEAVVALAQRLAAPLGRELTVTQPYVDARIDGLGLRLTATVPPFSRRPTLSLRKTRLSAADEASFIDQGFADAAVLRLLAEAVRARMNIVVFGATGSGKTTLARYLARHVPASERIVTIEETLELGLGEIHPHVVELETREQTRIAAAPMDMDQALRQALHMRPDRIVVGEVRHREALTFLMALGTGHAGSWTTLHASGAEEVFDRLALAMLFAAPQVEPGALRAMAARSVDLVVGVERDPEGRRRVVSVHEVAATANGRPRLRALYEAAPRGARGRGRAAMADAAPSEAEGREA
ncbi:MAG: Flp pilus assembly complex ATPase component TadA [Firmicutes bacterium]|nr:Flp pilus assembly complex ATPase component TadA [Bacillota bacterium]